MKSLAWRAIIAVAPTLAGTGEGTKGELLPPHSELPPTWWEQHSSVTVLAGAVALLVIACLVAVLCRRRPVVVTPPDVLARRELEALRGASEDGVLLVRVSGILRRYVLIVCGLPPDELTTAELAQTIHSRPQLDPALTAEITVFFRQCDERKFAPAPAAVPAGVVAAALDLINRIELARKPANAPAPTPSNPAPAA